MIRKVDRVTLIGVAHVLPKSAAEVGEVIERERPEVVAVELCPARYAALMRGEMGAPRVPLRLGASFLGWLLHFIQSRLARQTGTPAGEEMLSATEHARGVNARIELIDVDVNVTLERLMGRMGKLEKLRLLAELILGLLPFGKRVELEGVTEEEVVNRLVEELKRTSPTAYEVLIEQRNEHMANRLDELLLSCKGKIVCVVGAGHVPGLHQRLVAFSRAGWTASFEFAL